MPITELDLDPVKAQELLDLNKKNRIIRWWWVDELAAMIEDKLWIKNGDTIRIDTNNDILDGQHRLLAVVKAGIAVPTAIWDGLPPEARPTIDGGVKRQFADDLHMAGIKNSNSVGALIKRIITWQEKGGLTTSGKGRGKPRPELAQQWEKVGYEAQEAVRLTGRWNADWPGNNGGLVFLYWLLVFEGKNNIGTVNKFFDIITWGSQDTHDRILRSVRDIIAGKNKYKKDRGQTSLPYQVYFLIRAWDGWLRGDRLSRFEPPNGGLKDPFPTPTHVY